MGDEIDVQDSGQKSEFKKRLVPILVVALLLVGEGIGIFILIKAISPAPVTANADSNGEGEAATEDGARTDGFFEVEMADCRPSNRMSGKFVTFHIRVSALIPQDDSEIVQDLIRDRQARIDDGVNTVIRSADPKQLAEPGLETLKRQLKKEFDRILGDDKFIQEVLIPQLLESR